MSSSPNSPNASGLLSGEKLLTLLEEEKKPLCAAALRRASMPLSPRGQIQDLQEKYTKLLTISIQNLVEYEAAVQAAIVTEAHKAWGDLVNKHEEGLGLLFCNTKFRPRMSVFSDSFMSTDDEDLGTMIMRNTNRSCRLGSTQATMIIHEHNDNESDTGSPWEMASDGGKFDMRRHSGFSDGSDVIRKVARTEFQRMMKAKQEQLMSHVSSSHPEDVLTLTHNDDSMPLLIGKGGYGTVYHGTMIDDRSEVAVKILPLETLEDPKSGDIRDAALNELVVLTNIDHTNVVGYYGAYYYKKQNELWCVMEYCKGRSLNEDKLQMLDGAQVRRVAKDMLEALHYLRSKEWVHRDLKPENILDAGCVYKLSDFGLSKQADAYEEVRSTTVEGTLQYLAPEAFNPPHCVTSHLTDVYALGITLLGLYGVNVSRVIGNPDTYKVPPFQPYGYPPTGVDLSEALPEHFFDFICSCLGDSPLDRLSAGVLLSHPYLTATD